MVSLAAWKLGRIPTSFSLNLGQKMSDRDCPDALLMHAGLLPVICSIAEDVLDFQQDDAPALVTQ